MTRKATWHGKTIAESDRTLEVGGYVYFPRDTVRMDLLKSTAKTDNDLKCPHGVQFYDVIEGDTRSARGTAGQAAAGRPLDRLLGGCRGSLERLPVGGSRKRLPPTGKSRAGASGFNRLMPSG